MVTGSGLILVGDTAQPMGHGAGQIKPSLATLMEAVPHQMLVMEVAAASVAAASSFYNSCSCEIVATICFENEISYPEQSMQTYL